MRTVHNTSIRGVSMYDVDTLHTSSPHHRQVARPPFGIKLVKVPPDGRVQNQQTYDWNAGRAIAFGATGWCSFWASTLKVAVRLAN
eukprot:548863-Amphidinium_carterae.1